MRRLLGGLVLVGCLVFATALPAQASGPRVAVATGSFSATAAVPTGTLVPRGHGPVIDIPLRATATYTGSLTGSAVDTFVLQALPNGTFVAHGTEVCTAGCSIGGQSGGYVADFVETGTSTGYSGEVRFVSGTTGLAGLRGEGFFSGTTEITGRSTGTYSYRYSLGG